MENRLTKETLESHVEYLQTELDTMVKNKKYYVDLDMNKNFEFEDSQIALYNEEIENYRKLIDNVPVPILETTKVRVTTHNGLIIVETINPETFDQDFQRPILGSIGCSLWNTSRLEISNEAIEAIGKLKSSGDGLGDFMGDRNHFSWIGPEISIKDNTCVNSRDYRLPTTYKSIENVTSDAALKFLREYKSESTEIKETGKIQLWLEFNEKTEYVLEGEKYVYKHFDDYKFDFRAWYHPGHKEISTKIREALASALKEKNIDKYKTSSKETTLQTVRDLFELGFDNNIMNPHIEYWRMSIEAPLEDILERLNKLKIR
jgi:hypothetical protein